MLGILGELGNQMFQVAATYGYARLHGFNPLFPEWKCRISNSDYTNIFKVKLPQLTGTDSHQYEIIYNDLKYIQLGAVTDGNIDLSGYFQSEKYFEHCKEEIKEIFQPNHEIKEYLEYKYREIISLPNRVALHIRSGKRTANDYNVHAYTTTEFIEKAQTHFPDDSIYVVFADNMEIAKQLVPKDKKYTFIESTSKNYEDLFLMAYFDKYIISPSTFGWWGAYLSKYENPQVVIMKDWFAVDNVKNHLNDNDIIPDRWTKI
jgi:hypothetical protein